MKKYLFLLIGFVGLFVAFSFFVSPARTEALSGGDFKAGRIVDDNVFFDGNAMDIPTIQSFLNSKVPVCDTNGTKAYGGTTRAAYSASVGNPAPFTCLKNYNVDVWGVPADQYCGSIGYGNFSAAGIIWSVAKACNVSPKVLLILLQKEQSLVTDDWPWPIQYTKATGMGCPDSSLGTDVDANQNGCYDDYEGLFKQIYYAARQYQRYAKQPDLFNFKRNTNRNISYQANRPDCGSTPVYIENQATAALYNYTPYQPNAAALNNLYGTGDTCSAYGNRNFWRMYNDWFGNTYGIPFSASFRNISPAVTVAQNKKATLWMDFQNTGANFWKDELSAPSYYPITRLSGSWPINRVSPFATADWKWPNRPVSVFTKVFESDGVTLSDDQHTVWPGQVARFQFEVQYPGDNFTPGTYQENFELVQDGAPNFWVPGGYAWQAVTVPDSFTAKLRTVSPQANVSPGVSSQLYFDFENTGSRFWKDSLSAPSYYPITRLAGTWPINRVSKFATNDWLYPNRPVSVFAKVFENDGVTLSTDQHTVWPGQVARFQFNVQYPAGGVPAGMYKEDFDLVQDGIPNFWVTGGYAWQGVNASN
jgi:hypothetical protein